MTSPLSMIETLRDVVKRLEELGIDHMVTGSFAMSVYVPARTTIDIDIVMNISARMPQNFVRVFGSGYYVNSNSVQRAVERRSMFNIISLSNAVKVDCILAKEGEFARTAFAQRQQANIDGVDFYVITKDDLIISKLNWARESLSEMQFRDISTLVDSGCQLEYVEKWVRKLNLDDVYSKMHEWKTRAGK